MENILYVLAQLGTNYIDYLYYATTLNCISLSGVLISAFGLAAYCIKKASE